jgi:(2Fe-2S) ferredoxin
MSKFDQQVLACHLEGRFLGFVLEHGKPKRLQLMAADGEYSVKLAKDLRASVSQELIPGDWIQVWGEHKQKSGRPKFKAYKVNKTAPGQVELIQPATPPKTASNATILICQKSDCVKRGSKGVCRALEAALSDRDLTEQVTIRSTGCMKHCKAGPNLVFMPEKTRYSNVSARDATVLIDEQFSNAVPKAANDPGS